MSLEGAEAVRVKEEPECEEVTEHEAEDPESEACAQPGHMRHEVKEEIELATRADWYKEVVAKEEYESEAGAQTSHIKHEVKEESTRVSEAGAWGVSAAAARAGLYPGHAVKGELVVGPEELHRPKVVLVHPEPQNRMPAPNTLNRNGPVVYKRIRHSESDDAASPAKRIVIGSAPPTESPVKRVVGTSPVQSPVKRILVGSSKPVSVTSPPLTTGIREKRFRNMLEMFPEIAPLFIKNTLVKHGWNEERSRDELLKYDPETNDKAPTSSSYQGARPGFSGKGSRPNGSNAGVMRMTSRPVASTTTVVVRKPLAAQGGRARRGRSGSEDDGVRKGKDDRVYDRTARKQKKESKN